MLDASLTLCNAKQTCKGEVFKTCDNKAEEGHIPWGCEIGNGGCYNAICTCPTGEWCGNPSGGGYKICRNNLFISFLNFVHF